MEYNFSPILERVKLRKKELKITTETIMNKSGIPKGTLNKIFTGETTEPKITTMIALADALDISVNYLVYGIHTPKENPENYSQQEQTHIKKYRALDERGKQTVDTVLNSQYELIEAKKETTCGLSDEEIEKELESYKQELVAEQKGKTLSASTNSKGA